MNPVNKEGCDVVIVDYGLGNLYSVTRAVNHIGASVNISNDAATIKKAEKLILPGVGAFGDGMKGLSARGLIGPIKEFAESGKPILGICLGMQLFMTEGEEFGIHEGLDIIKGKTKSLGSFKEEVFSYKLPHIGWNRLAKSTAVSAWDGSILEGIPEGGFVYFVHSNAVMPDNPGYCLAETEYGGVRFCSVLKKDNIYGCQFHPERSGALGLEIYRRFVFGLKPEIRIRGGQKEYV